MLMLNLSFKVELETWILNLNFEFKFWTWILIFEFEFWIHSTFDYAQDIFTYNSRDYT